jgi:Fe-S cluster biosynthesis and repair protein YggX
MGETKGELYCRTCAEQLETHPYPHRRIYKIINEYNWDRWVNHSAQLTELAKRAKSEYQKFKPLIIYYEQEMLRAPLAVSGAIKCERLIQKDVQDVIKASEDATAFLAKKEDILQQGLIKEILKADSFYDHHSTLLSDCQYLSRLTDDILFDTYHEVINLPHSSPFTDFTQEHRDTYLRLKFRSLHSSSA